MIEVSEILYRWHKGDTKKNIMRSLGISRNTVKDLIKVAQCLGFEPGISSTEEIDKIAHLIIEARYKRTNKPGEVQARLSNWHDQFAIWLAEPNMTITQISRLLAERGDIFSETSLRTYIRRNFERPKKHTIHLETEPGKQGQVDYGYSGMLLDPDTNKLRKSYAFIMTLAHSRHRFVRFVFRQDVASWIDCHIRAFNFFGGVPETVLLDNLKSGVMKPHIYDPIINRSYAELERHYGFIADPAKVRKPEHKGKVERSVTIVRQQILAGRDHANIRDANEYALQWCRNEIAHRVTRTTGETPWQRFIRDEQPKLLPLAKKEFECPIWQEATVHKDHHMVFAGSFYSVPTQYIGQNVWVRATQRTIKIYYNRELIKQHVRTTIKGQWVTDTNDYPKSAKEFLNKTAEACLGLAKAMGDPVHKLILAILSRNSGTTRRKAQAILRLADKYGEQRLNKACQRALKYGNIQQESLKRILELNLDQESESAPLDTNTDGAYLRPASEFATGGVL